jgi:sulfotransferase family protein
MTTVLYVAGSGRSGSTLLARALGTVDGVAAVGEVRYLFQRGVIENRPCGCGRPFAECPFWRAVMTAAFAGDAAAANAVLRHVTRLRRVPWLLVGEPPVPAALVDDLARLYPAMAAEAGATALVDSSKLPSYAAVLAGVPGIDLRVVHLVRDPRAAAYSWTRRKALPDRGPDGYMQRQSVLKSALLWDAWNAAAAPLLRDRAEGFLTVRYEDFVAEPAGVLEDIVAFAGISGQAQVSSDGTAHLGVDHTVAGNPDRLRSGPVALRADDGWRAGLSRPRRALASVVTAPLRGRFGYRLDA